MEDFYNNSNNWLFPEVQQIGGASPLDNMTEAEEFLVAEFDRDRERPIVVNFSGGKDSLACLALAVKALKRLNDSRRPTILSSLTGYEQNDFWPWLDYLKTTLFPRFKWLAVKPTPFTSYIVETIGVGKPPVNMPNMRQCNGRWKQYPLQLGRKILTEKWGARYLSIVGTRAEESPRRRKRLEADGRLGSISGIKLCQPLGWITAATLWAWLEENIEGLTGVSYDRLQQYYADKGRDGCWLCSYHRDWSTLSPFQAWVQQYQKTIWEQAVADKTLFPLAKRDKQEKINAVWLTPYVSESCRSSIDNRKKWFEEIIAADKKYGEGLIKQVHIDFIKEIWNYQETYAADYGHYSGMKHWNHYREDYLPKMLNPYLYPIAITSKTCADGTVVDCVKKGEVAFYNEVVK